MVGQLASAMGGIRVDRGTGSRPAAAPPRRRPRPRARSWPDAAGHDPSRRGLLRARAVGRWGAARLAAMTKAPVIPIGLWGTEKVWPRSSRLPQPLTLVRPARGPRADRPARRPRVRHPTPTRSGSWRRSSRCCRPRPRKRTPTPEELARTFPPGKAPPQAAATSALAAQEPTDPIRHSEPGSRSGPLGPDCSPEQWEVVSRGVRRRPSGGRC